MWHKTWVPSMPTQLNVEWGNTLLTSELLQFFEKSDENIAYILFLVIRQYRMFATEPAMLEAYQESFCVKK